METAQRAKAGYIGLIVISIIVAIEVIWFLMFPSRYLGFCRILFVPEFAFAILLSFDSFRNYPQYGLSRNHPISDHLISVIAIATPFIAIFCRLPVLLGLAFFLKGMSLLRSPTINPDQPARLGFSHPASREFIKALLWVMIYVIMVAFGITDKIQAETEVDAQITEILQQSE